jgi:hypothetical protein
MASTTASGSPANLYAAVRNPSSVADFLVIAISDPDWPPHRWRDGRFGRELNNFVVSATAAHFMAQGRFMRREVIVKATCSRSTFFPNKPTPIAVYLDAEIRRCPILDFCRHTFICFLGGVWEG